MINQLLCGVHIAAEALAFAEAMGLEAGPTWEVLRHGAAASFMLDDRGARMVDNPTGEVRSALDIFVKDIGLVLGAARDNAYPCPIASAAEQLYLAGRRAGLGRNDDSSVIDVLRAGQAARRARTSGAVPSRPMHCGKFDRRSSEELCGIGLEYSVNTPN